MISILPMYDIPELRAQTDAFWDSLRVVFQELGLEHVPEYLSRPDDLISAWLNPGLFLGQTCGYPLVTYLRGRVGLVSVPAYTAEGCAGAYYRSAIMIRRTMTIQNLSDLKGKICAINSYDSNSGMNLLRAIIAPVAAGSSFFKEILVTGSHFASLHAVATGAADVAAIDCVTLALLSRYKHAALSEVRRFCWTPSTPALPFITGIHTSPRALHKLQRGLKIVSDDHKFKTLKQSLLLDHFETLPIEDYDQILTWEQDSIAAGYPILG